MGRSVASIPKLPLHFRSRIGIEGINPFVVVNATRASQLKRGWRKPMPVRIRINGKPDIPWRINLMPRGDGSFYLYLHEQVRTASGTKVGDVVDVEMEFDDEYRSGPAHPMPEWLGDALARDDRMKLAWDGLIPSRKKEILRYFAQLKSEEARLRNRERLLHVLSGGKARFMARDWNADSAAG